MGLLGNWLCISLKATASHPRLSRSLTSRKPSSYLDDWVDGRWGFHLTRDPQEIMAFHHFVLRKRLMNLMGQARRYAWDIGEGGLCERGE